MAQIKETLLVWVAWPEKCFSVNASDATFLRALAGDSVDVVVVKSERAFLRELPRATKAIVWSFKAEWFVHAPRLKLLATPGAGRELVPRTAPAGVTVHFGRFHGPIMAETVAGFMLAWARGFFRPERSEFWPRAALSDKCYRVEGTKAVILGYGLIGRAIGGKLTQLGVSVAGFHRANMGDLPAALVDADWLICALPGDTGTDNLVDAHVLHKLPRRAVLVNVGRGNAVDESALLDALRTERLAGAYLDVFRGEPSPVKKDEPVIYGAEYGHLPWNLIRMPHSCAFCNDYMRRAFKELKDDGLI